MKLANAVSLVSAISVLAGASFGTGCEKQSNRTDRPTPEELARKERLKLAARYFYNVSPGVYFVTTTEKPELVKAAFEKENPRLKVAEAVPYAVKFTSSLGHPTRVCRGVALTRDPGTVLPPPAKSEPSQTTDLGSSFGIKFTNVTSEVATETKPIPKKKKVASSNAQSNRKTTQISGSISTKKD